VGSGTAGVASTWKVEIQPAGTDAGRSRGASFTDSAKTPDIPVRGIGGELIELVGFEVECIVEYSVGCRRQHN